MQKLLDQQSLILIVDDSVEMIRLLSGMLKDEAQIIFATSGEAGLQLARQRHPTLILLDVEMPGMDGYEVCRTLKSDPDTQDSAVIFVTAQANMEAEVAALDAGAVDFITKPLNPPVVRARVKTHLNLRRHSVALSKLVNRDPLTGLYNRRYFDEQLKQEYLRHQRQKLPLGVALIDIDYFKNFNDHYGHLEGDACLIKVAQAIDLATRRPGESVTRFGGEEFVVILPYTSSLDLQNYGQKLCDCIGDLKLPHAHSATADHVTVSVGAFSMIPDECSSEQTLIAEADQALYRAKASGRNCAKVVVKA